MNVLETILILVIIGAGLKMLQDRRAQADDGLDSQMPGNRVSMQRDPDADRLREEVRMLKERLAVLERIATDNNRAVDLDREIDRLR